ncbi:hypothetical protein [Bacillus sp. Marseille-P3661]|uniref:hypothetical protein n=1 Tax=Bacillus sp. Marseille-P3661 TaxID=1936234 RepID=UPI000C867007|nr:hypothetical protein [Bacillus sp. Marseille-P3661]
MLKYIILLMTFVMGCNQIGVEDNQRIHHDSIISVPVFSKSNPYPMTVREEVRDNNVYVECVISNFTFSKRNEKVANKQGTGYIKLYLNNQKIDDIYTAAFIMKGLPKGVHRVKLELVNNDGTPYGVEKEFEVTVPN